MARDKSVDPVEAVGTGEQREHADTDAVADAVADAAAETVTDTSADASTEVEGDGGTAGPEPEDEPAAEDGAASDAHEQDAADSQSAESQDSPTWLTHVPYLLVLAMLAAGIVIVAAAYFKRGPALIAGALMLAAMFRAILPAHLAGMLAVRSRLFDLVLLFGLAVLLIVLAWVAPQL